MELLEVLFSKITGDIFATLAIKGSVKVNWTQLIVIITDTVNGQGPLTTGNHHGSGLYKLAMCR